MPPAKSVEYHATILKPHLCLWLPELSGADEAQPQRIQHVGWCIVDRVHCDVDALPRSNQKRQS